MRGDRGEFGRRDSAETPRPILRIAEERARGLELSRESALQIEDLPREIESARQAWRQRLLERRPNLVVFSRKRAVAVELIVESRQGVALIRDKDARRPMRRNRDRLDEKARAELLERANQESPCARGVEPQIRPGRIRLERPVRRGALGENRSAAIEDDELDVGLADVEDSDAAVHGLSPRPAPLPWGASKAAVSRRTMGEGEPGGKGPRSRTCRCSPWCR